MLAVTTTSLQLYVSSYPFLIYNTREVHQLMYWVSELGSADSVQRNMEWSTSGCEEVPTTLPERCPHLPLTWKSIECYQILWYGCWEDLMPHCHWASERWITLWFSAQAEKDTIRWSVIILDERCCFGNGVSALSENSSPWFKVRKCDARWSHDG